MNTYNLTKYVKISVLFSQINTTSAWKQTTDSLPFRVSVKSGKPLRSRLPQLPRPFIDEKTSSDKLSDLPKDVQQ